MGFSSGSCAGLDPVLPGLPVFPGMTGFATHSDLLEPESTELAPGETGFVRERCSATDVALRLEQHFYACSIRHAGDSSP